MGVSACTRLRLSTATAFVFLLLLFFRRRRFHSGKLSPNEQILEKAGSPRLVQKFIYEFQFEAVALLDNNVVFQDDGCGAGALSRC